MKEEIKSVPVHSLGISQIIAYGSLFYVFALIKSSIAIKLGLGVEIIAFVVSISLFIHVLTSVHVGVLIDKYGGMRVMSIGLLIGLQVYKDQIKFIKKLEDNKLLTIRAAENVIRILPPLNVKKSEINLAIRIIKKVCREIKV